jgi:hypothetical protein
VGWLEVEVDASELMVNQVGNSGALRAILGLDWFGQSRCLLQRSGPVDLRCKNLAARVC